MAEVVEGKFPHIEWLELNDDGVLYEVAVMKREPNGSVMFIRLDLLDEIDKTRLIKILKNRNIENFELWDMMSQVTLGNGANALKYFHQLVKILTPNGKVIDPRDGTRAAPVKTEKKAAKKSKKAE